MADKATIARPYAKAAFEHAQEQASLERWSKVLAAGASVVSEPAVEKLLAHPRVDLGAIVELIAEVAGESLDEHGRNFLKTLASNRRLGLLPEIAAQFEVLRAEVENVADVRIVSAVQLSEQQRERFSAALKKRLQREVRLHCEVDPSLIGGAIVRAGDFVIDGSLKSRLERLAGTMTR